MVRDLRRLSGVLIAQLTPFDQNGRPNLKVLETYTRWLISRGVSGLFPCGTTGEGLLMTTEERQSVAETVLAVASGQVPVIVHIGHSVLSEAISLGLHARENGALAAAAVVPSFYPLSQSNLLDYYGRLAEALDGFPLLVYNIPSLARNCIEPETMERLQERHPNVVGVKFSSPDFVRFREFVNLPGKPLVFLGCDGAMLSALHAGASGSITGPGSVFPEPYVALYRAVRSGDVASSQYFQGVVDKVSRVLKDGGSIGHLKYALAIRGLEAGCARPPLGSVPAEQESAFKAEVLELIRLVESIPCPAQPRGSGEEGQNARDGLC